MEDDLKLLKVEYFRNRLLDPIKICWGVKFVWGSKKFRGKTFRDVNIFFQGSKFVEGQQISGSKFVGGQNLWSVKKCCLSKYC